ncbi:hypothetical protein HOY80DRAFT_1043340 [Tuber brumale]|nr:hypothetical protein HOY80DRAFT_1043340 [Tuber brumale]
MAEIVKYCQDREYERLAVECLQVAVEEYLVMNMAACTLDAAHAGHVTLMISNLRLVNDVMNSMAGKADQEMEEELR